MQETGDYRVREKAGRILLLDGEKNQDERSMEKKFHMPISIQQWVVVYVMAYGLVLTFIDWHKEGGELVGKGKVKKFLLDNWI